MRILSIVVGLCVFCSTPLLAAPPASMATTIPAGLPIDTDPRGLVMVQETQVIGGPQPSPAQQVTMKIKGGKVRIDLPGGLGCMINEGATGNSMMVMHFNKIYTRQHTSQSAAKQGAEEAVDPNAPKPDKPKATGNKEMINGLEALEYAGGVAGSKSTFWVVPNFPDADIIRKKMEIASYSDPMQHMTRGQLMADPKDYPKGMIVRSEIQQPNGSKAMTSIVSVKLEDVADSEFQPPPGYQEQTVPAIPTVPQR